MENSEKKIEKWFLIPILLLGFNFIFRLVDQSKLLKYFPLDRVNDMSSYMAQLFFLKVCGFHNFCPYWYNGFIAFKFSPPGWYFFTYPLYLLFGDVKVASYFSMLTSFILLFLVIWVFGKYVKWSAIKRTAFFLFVFGNALAVGGFIRSGRFHELFAWLWFILIFFLFYYHLDKNLDWKFYLTGLFFGFSILTYQSVGVFASLLFLGFFLYKKGFDRIKIVFSVIIGLLISSFWWWPFIRDMEESTITSWNQFGYLFSFSPKDILTIFVSFVLPLALFIIFFFYYKSLKFKRIILFYLPFLILSFLFLTRLIIFIPILKDIFPDPYLLFFFFLFFFFLFNLELDKLNKIFKFLILFCFILFSIVSIFINIFHTPLFIIPGEESAQILSLFENVNDRYVMIGNFSFVSYPLSFYSYIPVYENLSSVSGKYLHMTSISYYENLNNLYSSFEQKDCSKFKYLLNKLNTVYVITTIENCNDDCLSKISETKGGFCLLKLE